MSIAERAYVDKESFLFVREFLPISAVWQFAYCPRRFYLIYVQGDWDENFFIADGFWKHKNVHKKSSIPYDFADMSQAKITNLWVVSEKLGLCGFVDVVEKSGEKVVVVEFKRGGRKPAKELYFADALLVSAQAICLSEHLKIKVTESKVFYFSSRRRFDVNVDLYRDKVFEAVDKMRELLRSAYPPLPLFSSKCSGCSLRQICLPFETYKIKKTKFVKVKSVM